MSDERTLLVRTPLPLSGALMGCCGEPCIVPEWRDGKHVYVCINCHKVVG